MEEKIVIVLDAIPIGDGSLRRAHLDTTTKSGRAELPLCPGFSPAMRTTVCQEETSPTLKREIGAARQRRPTNVAVSRCAPLRRISSCKSCLSFFLSRSGICMVPA
jgi:hypothetical protein